MTFMGFASSCRAGAAAVAHWMGASASRQSASGRTRCEKPLIGDFMLRNTALDGRARQRAPAKEGKKAEAEAEARESKDTSSIGFSPAFASAFAPALVFFYGNP